MIKRIFKPMIEKNEGLGLDDTKSNNLSLIASSIRSSIRISKLNKNVSNNASNINNNKDKDNKSKLQ